MGVLVVIWLIVGVVGLIAKSDFLGFVFLLIASGLAFLLFYSGTEGDWIVALVAAGLPFWIVSHGHAREGSWTFFFWLLTAAMLFGTGWTVTGGNGITAAILTAVVIVLSLIIKAVMWKVVGDRRKFKAAAEKAEQKRQEEWERQKKIARQKELEDRYAASPLTWQIICAISDGTDRKPEIIEVYDDHVTGCTNGVTRTFDFYANRVEPFTAVYEVASGRDIDIETKLRPQVALGAAINRQLGGEYDLADKGRWSRETHRYADGEFYYVIEYRSDHVRLTLKANNRF